MELEYGFTCPQVFYYDLQARKHYEETSEALLFLNRL